MAPVIDFEDTVVLLGRFPALAGLTMSVDPGHIVLLRGSNGAGKTTFLRTCAGLLPVSQGRARVLGFDMTVSRREVRPHIGLLGHGSQLYDDLTVADNLAFWGGAVGADSADQRAALEAMEVSPRLWNISVQKLSAGQRRRVAIAVLVARRPRLWLLDEPHAGLDRRGRDLLDGLLGAAAAAGATVVFASHELDRAEVVADTVVDIGGGRTLAATSLPRGTAGEGTGPDDD
ncbi:MAG TPA: heme ABC exporter ATP-binding protein CcmA [Acidimicrobiales bacterium]|nr:heme ABC exporter ATP-binding protein CcmA [Acidimicrobiales bacterium]